MAEQHIANIHLHMAQNGEEPRMQNSSEKELARWIANRRKDKKAKRNQELCERIEMEFPWWSWDPVAEKHESKIASLHEFYAKYGEPKIEGTRENEVALSIWIAKRRRDNKLSKKKELCDRIEKEFDWWSWDPVQEHHERTIKELHAFYAQYGGAPRF